MQATCTWKDGQAVVGSDAVRIISLVPHSIADICGARLLVFDRQEEQSKPQASIEKQAKLCFVKPLPSGSKLAARSLCY